MVSAQGADITTWRSVEHFAAAYRQTLLELAASERFSTTEMVFLQTLEALDDTISVHQKFLLDSRHFNESLPGSAPRERAELSSSFYTLLYHHFEQFRSAPLFYQLSMGFLVKTSETLIADITAQFGASAGDLPDITLIAIGPAGRGEYSPFCRLQLLIVHGDVSPSRQGVIARFSSLLHEGFEAVGLAVDPIVNPRNPEWRGTLTEWHHRCQDGLDTHEDEKFINLCRLVDQYPLSGAAHVAEEFKKTASATLHSSRTVMAKMVERMTTLSNGLGLMGRLKLEKSGSERGLFRLLDHGLLPLSAALSALSQITGCVAVNSCARISELLKRGELAVELAERMLATWHTLNGMRLSWEYTYAFQEKPEQLLCLNPKELSPLQLQTLTESLESVLIIQHHVKIIFSGMEE